jgi:CheY-like chemotaxis protein
MSQHTILIVDDEPNQRMILEQALHMFDADWTVIAAKSASEALEMIDRQMPDLIITDYHMPEMTGLELIEQIQARKLPIHVIVMTAYGSPDVQDAAEALGVTHFLTKPVPLTTLRRLTVAALRAGSTNGTGRS